MIPIYIWNTQQDATNEDILLIALRTAVIREHRKYEVSIQLIQNRGQVADGTHLK
jgi:hypothetical protein